MMPIEQGVDDTASPGPTSPGPASPGPTTGDRTDDHRDGTPVRSRDLQRVVRLALAVLSLQFIGLLAYSGLLYRRFTLGIDFGIYFQAFALISHGHLDPYSTIVGYPFIQSHFELIVWPLSLLLVVFRTAFVILVVQDASLVGTGVLVVLWIAALVERRQLGRRAAVGTLAVTTVMVLVNPLVYYTAALDFHIEATATFFAVFAAYDIWSGRHRRAVIWLALCLLCGDLGGLYVVGVGVSATLASRSTRKLGLLSILAGVAWVAVISLLGANKGSGISAQYAYVAGRAALPAGASGLFLVLHGAVAHPNRLLDRLGSRWSLIGSYLLPGGVIGIVTPWGLGVPLLVLATSGFDFSTLFLGEPFQQFAVFPFVLFGTMSVVAHLASGRPPALVRNRQWRRTRPTRLIAATLVTLGVLGVSVYFATQRIPKGVRDNGVGGLLPGDEAGVLGSVLARTPFSTQVIFSGTESGRFSGRPYISLILYDPTVIPIQASRVLLVMDTGHNLLTPAQEAMTARTVSLRFHARTQYHRSDLWVLEWSAPPNSPPIALP